MSYAGVEASPAAAPRSASWLACCVVAAGRLPWGLRRVTGLGAMSLVMRRLLGACAFALCHIVMYDHYLLYSCVSLRCWWRLVVCAVAGLQFSVCCYMQCVAGMAAVCQLGEKCLVLLCEQCHPVRVLALPGYRAGWLVWDRGW